MYHYSRQRVFTTALLLIATFGMLAPTPALADPLDFDLPGGSGHFYRQANGQGGQGNTGYAITDDQGIAFWDAYRRLGGPAALGYPASQRFIWDGFTVQVTQKAVLQWRPDTSQVAYVNVLDRLHDLGKDGWLQAFRQIPPPLDSSADIGLSWQAVEQRHWQMLDVSPAIKAVYRHDSDPLDHFGLPVSSADEGSSVVIRAQRAAFQYWKVNVPWAKQGDVTIVNAGDLAKEAGLFPAGALLPEDAGQPGAAGARESGAAGDRSHNWRSPGFVAAVGGELFDPRCVPLQSAGSNVPNLLYQEGLADNLEWMRQHHMRWFRVFMTGHTLGANLAPASAATAISALHGLLHQVEAFNAAHDPSEAIYVLVSLTDYYPPGVPGDRYAFDHPTFAQSPVLAAPWFRAGVRQFDFDQEHNFGFLTGLPNYEVNYKPWVQQVVAGASQSPALLGWQLGNELKARGSPRNLINSAQAYSWYLDFTRDMVDTIRSIDRNHLIVMGAQYIAELTDWEYRPHDTLQPDRVPEYRHLMSQMLAACGAACWNVWSVTADDFNPYPLDDAASFAQAGVPVLATEYSFSRATPDVMQARFGGDRAAALLDGFAKTWTDLEGALHAKRPGLADLLTSGTLAGAAPWGSPAPDAWASLDTDTTGGITGTPDQAAMWAAWGDVAGRLESLNQTTGTSATCLSYRS